MGQVPKDMLGNERYVISNYVYYCYCCGGGEESSKNSSPPPGWKLYYRAMVTFPFCSNCTPKLNEYKKQVKEYEKTLNENRRIWWAQYKTPLKPPYPALPKERA